MILSYHTYASRITRLADAVKICGTTVRDRLVDINNTDYNDEMVGWCYGLNAVIQHKDYEMINIASYISYNNDLNLSLRKFCPTIEYIQHYTQLPYHGYYDPDQLSFVNHMIKYRAHTSTKQRI